MRTASGWTEAEPDPAVVAEYFALFRRLLELEGLSEPNSKRCQPILLGWTPCGKAAWVEYVTGLAEELNTGGLPAHLRGAWAKLEAYGARLALVVHVCRYVCGETSSAAVDSVSMAGAQKLIAYFQAHARRVYPQMRHPRSQLESDCRAILAWLARHLGELPGEPARFSWRRLRRDLHNRFAHRDEDLRQALDVLVARGYLRLSPRPKPRLGRPPEPEYLIHPGLTAWIPYP